METARSNKEFYNFILNTQSASVNHLVWGYGKDPDDN